MENLKRNFAKWTRRTPPTSHSNIQQASSLRSGTRDDDEDYPNMYRKLSHQERMTLSPWEKFRKYKRVPYKLILNIALVVLMSTFFILRNVQYSGFVGATTSTIKSVLGVDSDQADEDTGLIYLNNIDDFTEHLRDSVENYYNISNEALSAFIISNNVVMTVEFLDGVKNFYDVSKEDPMGPFDNPDNNRTARLLIQSCKSVHLNFTFENQQAGPYVDSTFTWDVSAMYSGGGGRFAYDVAISSTIKEYSNNIFLIFNSFLCVIVVLSIFLTMKTLLRSLETYLYARKWLKQPPNHECDIVWSKLSFSDKMAFFNLWQISSLVGDMFVLLGCIFAFSKELGYRRSDHGAIGYPEVFHGLGLFLAWISMIKYLEWDGEFYMLILAVKASMTRVCKFIITVSPLYLAYIFLGMAVFSDHEAYFGDVFKSSRTLFALLNGDSMLLIFQQIQQGVGTSYAFFGELYLYSFCVLFITTILNVFVFIIESGYDAARTALNEREMFVTMDHLRLKEILKAAQERKNGDESAPLTPTSAAARDRTRTMQEISTSNWGSTNDLLSLDPPSQVERNIQLNRDHTSKSREQLLEEIQMLQEEINQRVHALVTVAARPASP